MTEEAKWRLLEGKEAKERCPDARWIVNSISENGIHSFYRSGTKQQAMERARYLSSFGNRVEVYKEHAFSVRDLPAK